MKSKGKLKNIALYLVVVCFGVNAYAEEASISPEEAKRITDESKRVADENAKLKKALEGKLLKEAHVENKKSINEEVEDKSPSEFWIVVGEKYWLSTLKPGDGSSRAGSTLLSSINLGYSRVFINMSSDDSGSYSAPGYPGTIKASHGTFSLAYLITNEVAISYGHKTLDENFSENPAPYSYGLYPQKNGTNFTTYGASYNHSFTDSHYSIMGSLTSGQGSVSAQPGYDGTTSGSVNYLAYDLGAAYSITDHIKFNIFYRVEKWDSLSPTVLYSQMPQKQFLQAHVEILSKTLSGPGAGLTVAF